MAIRTNLSPYITREGASPWCKTAKKKMIDLGWPTETVAEKTGLTRNTVSLAINGARYNQRTIDKISQVLDISNEY